jgi:hypothetical protein
MRNLKSKDFGNYSETNRMRIGNIKKMLIFTVCLLCFTFMFSVFSYANDKIEEMDSSTLVKTREDK